MLYVMREVDITMSVIILLKKRRKEREIMEAPTKDVKTVVKTNKLKKFLRGRNNLYKANLSCSAFVILE